MAEKSLKIDINEQFALMVILIQLALMNTYW